MKKQKLLTALLVSLSINHANATILWVGSEDIDFPNGSASCASTGDSIRTGYARASVNSCSGLSNSKTFPGGAVTSSWLSARLRQRTETGKRFFGVIDSATNKGLYIGSAAASGGKLTLWKYDGSTFTALTSETGASLGYNAFDKFDVEIQNFGASATVNIYFNAAITPLITYTGDVTAGGNTNYNSTSIGNWDGHVSEFIVADEDTRLMSVVTNAPNAAGTTNNWTGAYTDIDETATSDVDTVSEVTSGDNFQCNLSDLPSTNFIVKGVKVAARASWSNSGISGLKIGLFTNSTSYLSAPFTLPVGYTTYESYYSTNPFTSSAWTPTEINALQLNIQSSP